MIKILLSCVGKYKKDSLLAPTFVIFEVIIEVIIPLLMANMIDYGIVPGDMSYIIKLGAVLIVATFFSLVFGVLAGNFAARASVGFARNLRQRIFYMVQDFSFFNIDKFSTAGLVTRLTTDITNVQNAYQVIIRVAVRSPVMLIFSLLMAFSINHRLSLVFQGRHSIFGFGILFDY